MKRLFIFLLLLFAVYSAKPYWEQPVSQYVNLDFLTPIDEGIEKVVTNKHVEKTVSYVSNAIDGVFDLIVGASDNEQSANAIPKPKLKQPKNGHIAILNFEIGTPLDTVVDTVGLPLQYYTNEYGTMWQTYHQDYHNFLMISYDDQDQINALYTNHDLISSEQGIRYGSSKESVREIYGEPLTELKKGINVFLLQESEEFDLFEDGDSYLYFFYDIHNNDQVTALQIVSKDLEKKRPRIYATESSALRAGFERQLFDLTNATRVKYGLSPLAWDEQAAIVAQNHSADMATNNFFSHENRQGLSPFDRMKNAGITFRSAGENLAYGQASSIFAHEGLMNSKGHRENILLDKYEQVGIGVAFNEESQPFYTSKFLLK